MPRPALSTLAGRLSLLKHDDTAVFGPYFQLPRLPNIGRHDGALQRSERLRDGGSAYSGGERDKLLRRRAAYKHHLIFPAGLQASCSDLQVIDRPQ